MKALICRLTAAQTRSGHPVFTPDPCAVRVPFRGFAGVPVDWVLCVVIVLLYSRRRFGKHTNRTGANAEPCQAPVFPLEQLLAGVGDPGGWVSTVSGRTLG